MAQILIELNNIINVIEKLQKVLDAIHIFVILKTQVYEIIVIHMKKLK